MSENQKGGKGDSAIGKIVTDPVIVSSPDLHPDTPGLGGTPFLSGSPAGREAKPVLRDGKFSY